MNSPNRFHVADIAQIHSLVLQLRLDRRALLAGIPPTFVSTIPTHDAPAAQFLEDLHILNSTQRLIDGTDPLEIWFTNAIALAGPLPERLQLESYDRQRAHASSTNKAGTGTQTTDEQLTDALRILLRGTVVFENLGDDFLRAVRSLGLLQAFLTSLTRLLNSEVASVATSNHRNEPSSFEVDVEQLLSQVHQESREALRHRATFGGKSRSLVVARPEVEADVDLLWRMLDNHSDELLVTVSRCTQQAGQALETVRSINRRPHSQ